MSFPVRYLIYTFTATGYNVYVHQSKKLVDSDPSFAARLKLDSEAIAQYAESRFEIVLWFQGHSMFHLLDPITIPFNYYTSIHDTMNVMKRLEAYCESLNESVDIAIIEYTGLDRETEIVQHAHKDSIRFDPSVVAAA